MVIDHLPIFSGLRKVDDLIPRLKLSKGTSPETSGGLLMMFSQSDAEKYIKELKQKFNKDAWIVGRVERGTGKAHMDLK